MLTAFILLVAFWLLFNLFLFSWLGPARSRQVSLTTIANFRAAVRGERRA